MRAPIQLEYVDSETVIVRVGSLGLSGLQGFEEHAPESQSCTSYADRLIGKRHQAKGCRERDGICDSHGLPEIPSKLT